MTISIERTFIMSNEKNGGANPLRFAFRIVQGALIGLGAVLPGISGGVLSVIFGIYKPIMELLSNPIRILEPMSQTDPRGDRESHWFSRRCKHPLLFSGKISGSVCVFVHWPDCRNAPVSVPGSRRAGQEYWFIYFSDNLHVRGFALLIGTENVFRGSDAKLFLVSVLLRFCLALSVIAPGMSFPLC